MPQRQPAASAPAQSLYGLYASRRDDLSHLQGWREWSRRIPPEYRPADRLDPLRKEMDIDASIWRQYIRFLSDLARKDLGISLPNGVSVSKQLLLGCRRLIHISYYYRYLILSISSSTFLRSSTLSRQLYKSSALRVPITSMTNFINFSLSSSSVLGFSGFPFVLLIKV